MAAVFSGTYRKNPFAAYNTVTKKGPKSEISLYMIHFLESIYSNLDNADFN